MNYKCETCSWRHPETCKVCKQAKSEDEKDIAVHDTLCRYYSKLYGLKEEK